MAMKRVVVYGGSGALGRAVVKKFAAEKWQVVNVDLVSNADASFEILVDDSLTWKHTSDRVLAITRDELKGQKLDAVVNVAGGWAGGNAASPEFLASVDLMWKQSVHSSVIAAQLASAHMTDSGLLVLPGAAAAAQGGTSFMIGYGMAKAAVHHLVSSLAQPDSGLPTGARVVGVLPSVIDTPGNRAGMPDADFTSWTPPEAIA
eukprot:gene11699-18041_t